MEKIDEDKQKELLDVATHILDGTFDIKEYYGITNEGLEAIYAAGYEFYKNKKYDKAQQTFSILCFLDNTSKKFYYSLGAASFMLQQYQVAEIAFRMSLMVGNYTLNVFMRLAECCLLSGKIENAVEFLEEIIRLSGVNTFKDDKESLELSVRASMILEGIKKKKEISDAEKKEIMDTEISEI